MRGECQPYSNTQRFGKSLCDDVFENGSDYVYIPNDRFKSLNHLRYVMEDLTPILGFVEGECRRFAPIVICTYFYSPCGSDNLRYVPKLICPEVCHYLSEDLCHGQWQLATTLLPMVHGGEYRLPDCNNTNEHFKFLNLSSDCCTNANVTFPGKQC